MERYAINSLDAGREQVWKKTGETNEGVASNKEEGKQAKGGNEARTTEIKPEITRHYIICDMFLLFCKTQTTTAAENSLAPWLLIFCM